MVDRMTPEAQLERWKDAEGRQRRRALIYRKALDLVPAEHRQQADAYLKTCAEAGYFDD